MGDDWASVRGFHCWTSLAGVWYARLELSSPPVVIRAESLDDLRSLIDKYHDDHDESGPAQGRL